VFITNGENGIWRVRVRAQQVAQGGAQPFAITVRGNYAHTPRINAPARAWLPALRAS
jgi:hypothetical protein